MKQKYLATKYVNGKPLVVWFLKENEGVVVVNETGDYDYQFGEIYTFNPDEFELLPPDQNVRLSN